MRKNNFRILLFVFISTFWFCISVNEVSAATFDKGSTRIYYSGAKIVSGGSYTYYNKKLDGSIAYCAQFGKKVPSNGVSYSILTGTNAYQKDAFVAGQIITIGRSKYSGQEQYLYISEALNCYFKYNGYYSAACSDSKISGLVSTAQGYVANYKYTSGSSSSSLPSVNVSYSAALNVDSDASTSSNMIYKSGNVVISGINSTKYGSVSTANTSSTVPSYTLSISSSASGSTAQLCNSSGCLSNGDKIKANGTYYIKVTKGGASGGSVTLKINGSNNSTYPSAKRWYYTSGTQRLVTNTSVTITRKVSASATFKYSDVDKYSVSISKVDDSGEILPGASLRLFTAADKNGKTDTVTLCQTSASDEKASCSKSGLTEYDNYKYTSGRYICYSESTTPSGYISIDTKCEAINLSSATKYYRVNVSTSDEEYVSQSEYTKAVSYEQGTDLQYKFNTDDGVQYNTSKTLYKYTYSDGRSPEYKTTNEEHRHVTNSENGDSEKEEWYIENEDGSVVNITVSLIEGTLVCYNETAGENTNTDYCSGDYSYSYIAFSSGSAVFNVGNSLNYVNISKRSITGTDEISGAKLSIYKAENGTCSSTLATSKKFVYSEYNGVEGSDGTSGSDSGEDSSGNTNTSGSETTDVDTEEGNEAGGDIATEGLSWLSSDTSVIVYGLAPGSYCLQEEVAPKGYKKTTTVVQFSMDENGKVTTDSKDNYDEESNTLFLTNDLTNLSVSKTDVATGKELPGAELSICETNEDNGKIEMSVDDMGDCTVVSLASGKLASWTSTDEPYKIEGLRSGTYYLVEKTAPDGYSTAESVLFTLKEDGTLVDANGASLANNKLVMQDSLIKDVKTGDLPIIIIFIIAFIAFGGFLYYYNGKSGKPSNNMSNKIGNKIRKRKLHNI